MPGNYRMARRRYRGPKPVVNSIKNVVYIEGSTGVTLVSSVLATAKDAPITANKTEVLRGCIIKAFWLSVDVCGLAGTGVLQSTAFYVIKNPGNNLTLPTPTTEGSSNEKKYIFKSWNAMTMRNQDGNVPYHWEGWIKIPKRYQRFGTDDRLQISFATTTAAGHSSLQCIYKWYT